MAVTGGSSLIGGGAKRVCGTGRAAGPGFSQSGAALLMALTDCERDQCPSDAGCPACDVQRQACADDLF